MVHAVGDGTKPEQQTRASIVRATARRYPTAVDTRCEAGMHSSDTRTGIDILHGQKQNAAINS